MLTVLISKEGCVGKDIPYNVDFEIESLFVFIFYINIQVLIGLFPSCILFNVR